MKKDHFIHAGFIAVIFLLAACQPTIPMPTQIPTSPLTQPATMIAQLTPEPSVIPSSPIPVPSEVVQPADLVLTNGFIYTVDKDHTVANAMAVRGDTIVYVGALDGVQNFIGKQTKVIDLEGRLVLPGLIDSHAHAASSVSDIYEVSLFSFGSLKEYQKAIATFRADKPDLKVLVGGGWINSVFDSKGPTAAMLDAVVSDIPVILYSQDYHSVWANSQALKMAGITQDKLEPSGGIIERDEAGRPLGTLRETAVNLVTSIIPSYTTEQYRKGLIYFQDFAHSLGLTTVYIPSILNAEEAGLKALHDLEASGELTIRYPTAIKIQPEDDLAVVDSLVARRAAEAGGYFEIVAAKIFMDGVLEGGTAYLEEPYLNQAGNGTLLWNAKKYNELCATLDKAGIQIHVHSIGDAATRIALDGFAYARQQNGRRDARNIITHLQLVRKQDITRIADLEVVAVPQPYWFVADPFYFPQTVAFVGQERAEAQYPMKSLFDMGIRVASSSDYPVTKPPNPMSAIETGVTRSLPADYAFAIKPGTNTELNPAEKVTVEQMIESFTINGAYALHKENMLGSLEVGKQADFIVLSQNILQIEPTEIHKTMVLLTFLNGQEVYRNKDFDELIRSQY